MAQAIIMAGGIGERFWPLTSSDFPKYRIRHDDGVSLLQATFKRLSAVYGSSRVHVITGKDHVRHIRAELSGLQAGHLHVEPFRNNTASAIHLTCEILRERYGEEEVFSFFPADHLIRNLTAFKNTLNDAIRLASETDRLVTIGIRPTFPATGYGYIERGPRLTGAVRAYAVARFVEKPDAVTASRYLKSGRYSWNGGIFTWTARTYFEQMRRHAPQFLRPSGARAIRAAYGSLPDLSIDRVLMERSKSVAVLLTPMDWCDMGSWDMFYEKATKDRAGNATIGRTHLDGVENSLVYNALPEPLCVSRMRDTLIVRTTRGMLICPRGASEQAVRRAVRVV